MLYKGNNFAADQVQITSDAIRLLSDYHLTNEVEFTNSVEAPSASKTDNEVLTMIELPQNEQVSATISTPNYPLNYPSDSNVAFFIRTSGSYSLQLEFTDFDVETNFDSVFVVKVDRENSEKTFVAFPSKNDDSFVYNSDGKDLLIILKTDCDVQSRGFKGVVKVLSSNEPHSSSTTKTGTSLPSSSTTTPSNKVLPVTSQCGDLKLVGNGVIRSPGWPDYYPVDSSCKYLVSARNNQSIDLEFKIISVRNDNKYMRDHIIVYLGNSEKDPILAVLNGYNQSHHFITNTSQVLIKFKSYADSFFNHGFSVAYKETNEKPFNLPTCGGLVKHNARIYLPNYATYKSLLCKWRFQADVNKKANVTVYINNLPYSAASGSYGIQVYKGPSEASKKIGSLYNANINRNFTYVSDSEYLYLTFYAGSYKAPTSTYFYSYLTYLDFVETD